MSGPAVKRSGVPEVLRVGLIGVGVMGRAHARAWSALPGAFAGVYTPDDSARQFARQHGVQAYDTLDDLFADTDVVDICTPTPSHPALTLAAARAGCHVCCEKPAALTVPDVLAMERGCEAAGVRLFVAHVLRFFPQYRAARDLVVSGELGTPRVIRLNRVSAPPPAGSWLLDERQSGGVPLDLMLHDLDYARWLAGDVSEVYAVQARRAEQVMVQATLRHTGGAITLIEAGWAAPAGVFFTSLDIAGTAGATEWKSSAPPPMWFHGAPPPASPQEGAALPTLEGDPYTDELHHAYHALQQGTPFLVTPADAAAAVALGLAVQASLETARPVVPQHTGQEAI
ncbi:Gfo/Idh/MocA family oxidoreductase (plasmid) [Deinococcus sp. KNUC1210]|uniref:Gfo/Idh/MocA family protein n=1 Tax=Deinococcus sp. KNUC1210 TaxID=2917691 RepID=UPI001EEF7B86|nr:Gfo/Idh/MocA family oxidoreductase [Deinococcus sp. KNUC1210]ULH17617.1 Gfo/Idh/MocA family oxidoreductase [Deinococcus sp. KNUC1210]